MQTKTRMTHICHDCKNAQNGLNGKFCTTLHQYVEYYKEAPCKAECAG